MKLKSRDANTILSFVLATVSRPGFLNSTENHIFTLICLRTIRWGKLVEKIPTKHFTDGLFTGHIVGHGICKRRVYKAKTSLEQKGVLLSLGDNCYMINVPAILRVAVCKIVLENGAKTNKKFQRIITELSKIIHDTEAWMKERKIKIRTTSDSLEMIEQDVRAIEQKAKKRKRQKENGAAWALFQTWIDEAIDEFWPNGEIKQSKEWNPKRRGQAKNWLKSFRESGRDPRAWVREVVENWMRISVGIKDQWGNPTPLSAYYISVAIMYPVREEIERALIELRSRPKIRLVCEEGSVVND
jgi:hypothetical protein